MIAKQMGGIFLIAVISSLATLGVLRLDEARAYHSPPGKVPSAAQALNPAVGIGHYQLLSSQFSSWYNQGKLTETAIFRIDTTTGKTWRYEAGKLEGKNN